MLSLPAEVGLDFRSEVGPEANLAKLASLPLDRDQTGHQIAATQLRIYQFGDPASCVQQEQYYRPVPLRHFSTSLHEAGQLVQLTIREHRNPLFATQRHVDPVSLGDDQHPW